MAVDPLWEKYRSLNTYQYAANNPMIMMDPGGKVLEDSKGNVIFVPIGDPRNNEYGSQTVLVQPGLIFTNLGNSVLAYKNLSGDVGFDTDCHGLTMAKGEVWLDNPNAQKIIDDDYEKSEGGPKEGDIGAFYNTKNELTHSVNVTTVTTQGIIVTEDAGNDPKSSTKPLTEALLRFLDTKEVRYYQKKDKNIQRTDQQVEVLTKHYQKNSTITPKEGDKK